MYPLSFDEDRVERPVAGGVQSGDTSLNVESNFPACLSTTDSRGSVQLPRQLWTSTRDEARMDRPPGRLVGQARVFRDRL